MFHKLIGVPKKFNYSWKRLYLRKKEEIFWKYDLIKLENRASILFRSTNLLRLMWRFQENRIRGLDVHKSPDVGIDLVPVIPLLT